MNPTIFRHAIRQSVRPALLIAAGYGLFFWVILLSASAFLTDPAQVPGLLARPPRAMSAFLGGAADFRTPAGWLAVGMFHPVVLALQSAGAFLVAGASGAAELERGTIDLVLSRPVGRTASLLSRMAAGLALLAIVEIGGVAGALIARATVEGVNSLPIGATIAAFGASLLLFIALGTVSFAIFARARLRSRALGASIGLTVGWFFVNFVALVVDDVSWMRFLTPFHYFSAPDIVGHHANTMDLGVLGALAVVAGLAALWMFARRDLSR